MARGAPLVRGSVKIAFPLAPFGVLARKRGGLLEVLSRPSQDGRQPSCEFPRPLIRKLGARWGALRTVSDHAGRITLSASPDGAWTQISP
jgi:hypothetical protein